MQPEEQWTFMLRILTEKGVLAEASAECELTNMLRVFTRNLAAAEKYQLQPTEQKVVLFRARDSFEPYRVPAEWATWAADNMDFHMVPGDHYSMMKSPNVRVIAERLEHYLKSYASDLTIAPSETR